MSRGADIVICPRVTDAALVLGPAAWKFGWKRDEWDKLAGAITAGHIIECGAQCTGGNYAFFREIPNIARPGFPIADPGGMGPLFTSFRDPVTGRELLIDQNLFIGQIVANATVTRKMSDEEMTAYRRPFLDPKTRFPIYVWPNELPMGGKPARNVEAVEQVAEWLRTSETPKLLLYARPGAIVSPENAEWMAREYRNIETRFVGYGSHYIQEDNPETIGRSIADWYRQLAKNSP